MNIAIIPARGGSKRIPRKNIKSFLGKPIIAYSIIETLKCGLFSEVIVSTDDDEIADIAIKYGAKVPFFRSAETANDYAPLAAVVEEVVVELEKMDYQIDNICCILPTAPLISADDIIALYNKLISDITITSVIPVVRFSYPILRSLSMDAQGMLKMNWAEYLNTRSQDLSPAYHDSGSFYWISRDVLLCEHKIITEKCAGVEVDELKVQDIDTETDWRLAELKYTLIYG